MSIAFALVFALSGGFVYVLNSASIPVVIPAHTRQSVVLAHGHSSLDVPLMTMYTAPKIPNGQVDSWVNWTVASTRSGPSTTYLFDWNLLSKPSQPVQFVLNVSAGTEDSGFRASDATPSGFAYLPQGTCSGTCILRSVTQGAGPAGVHALYYEIWRMNYTVRRITDTYESTQTTLLEVEFSITRWGGVGDSLPLANVTMPGAGNLLDVAVYRAAASSWISLSARGVPSVPDFFRNKAATVTFDAGSEGSLVAELTSRYRWSSVDDYVLSFKASQDTTIRYLFDLRFGSLLIEYVMPPN